MMQVSSGRSDKQQQEQTSPNLAEAFYPSPVHISEGTWQGQGKTVKEQEQEPPLPKYYHILCLKGIFHEESREDKWLPLTSVRGAQHAGTRW